MTELSVNLGLVEKLVALGKLSFLDLPSSLQTKQVLLLALASGRPDHYELVDQKFLAEPEIALWLVRDHGLSLTSLPEPLRDQPNIVLLAVQRQGCQLKHAGPNCQHNRKICLAAVEQNNLAYDYCPAELKADPTIALAYLEVVKTLESMPSAVQANRELVLKVVSWQGLELKYASQELQADYQVVLTAARQNPEALAYAKGDLPNRALILELMAGSVANLPAPKLLGRRLLENDSQLMQLYARQSLVNLRLFGRAARSDTVAMLAIIKREPKAYQYVSRAAFQDINFLVELAKLGIWSWCCSVEKLSPAVEAGLLADRVVTGVAVSLAAYPLYQQRFSQQLSRHFPTASSFLVNSNSYCDVSIFYGQ